MTKDTENQREARIVRRRNRSERELPDTFPFHSAEEVWFWFLKAQQARADGHANGA